jgi:hypothetical protein
VQHRHQNKNQDRVHRHMRDGGDGEVDPARPARAAKGLVGVCLRELVIRIGCTADRVMPKRRITHEIVGVVDGGHPGRRLAARRSAVRDAVRMMPSRHLPVRAPGLSRRGGVIEPEHGVGVEQRVEIRCGTGLRHAHLRAIPLPVEPSRSAPDFSPLESSSAGWVVRRRR